MKFLQTMPIGHINFRS